MAGRVNWTQAVIAAVVRQEEAVLLALRPAGKRHGLKWEFPGGKVRSGESIADAITRELREELGVDVVHVGRTLFTATDPESEFEVHFIETEIEGVPKAIEHDEIRWEHPMELSSLPLAPADEQFAVEVLCPAVVRALFDGSGMSDRRLEEALRHFHPPPGTRLWHGGASVLGALRGVRPEVALWKLHPDRHSIWELALHIAYWNYAVRRRITGEPSGGFPRSPANWPDLPDAPTSETWKEDRKLVRETHDSLVEALRSFDASRLDQQAGEEGGTSYADLITGIVMHDTYHVGQIQLLKRLAKSHNL